MKVKIQKLTDKAFMPTKGTEGAAAYDLYVPADKVIKTGRNIIKLGIAMQLPHSFAAEIEPRSGYSAKGFVGVTLSDTERRFDCDVIHGLIDEDYRGEVSVIVKNNDEPFIVKQGQRIAQMIIHRINRTTLVEVDELEESKRGAGGFGSTGA